MTLDRSFASRSGPRALVACLAAAMLASCGPSAEEQAAARQESMRQARADSMAQAEAIYDAAAYDSISWAHADSALARGATVYRFSCQRCHGFLGHGDGDLATEHELEMPDITVEDWEYDGDLEAIRHRIFVGHESEMPNWGLHGLEYRDIDAVAKHIMAVIRGG